MRASRGYTLIELMYALFVFEIGLTGVLAFQVAASKASQQARDLSLANNLASSVIEELRVTPPADVVGTHEVYFDPSGMRTADPNHFTVSWLGTADVDNTFIEVALGITYKLKPDDTYVHEINVNTRIPMR